MTKTRTVPLFLQKKNSRSKKKNGEYVFKIHLKIVKRYILYNRKKVKQMINNIKRRL